MQYMSVIVGVRICGQFRVQLLRRDHAIHLLANVAQLPHLPFRVRQRCLELRVRVKQSLRILRLHYSTYMYLIAIEFSLVAYCNPKKFRTEKNFVH